MKTMGYGFQILNPHLVLTHVLKLTRLPEVPKLCSPQFQHHPSIPKTDGTRQLYATGAAASTAGLFLPPEDFAFGLVV